MKFMMHVTCGVENVDYPDEAIVDIDKPLAEQLLKRRAAFQGLHAYDRDLWEIYFYGSTCQFVGGEWDAESRGEEPVETSIGEQLGRDFGGTENDAEYEVLPPGFTPKYTEARTECDQVIVSDTGVRVMAYQKYTDFEIRTGEIPWEEVEKAAKEDEPTEPESDETVADHGLGHVLVEEDTEVWDITFEPTIELPADQDNTADTVKEYWSETLSVNDDRVIDWGHEREPQEVANARWTTHLRALVRVEDATAWAREVRDGSTWMARLVVVNAPVRRTLKAGYREGQMFQPEPRAGVEIGDQKACVRCLSSAVREAVTDQHELTEGELFRCSVCHGDFIVPPEEAL